MTRCCCCLAVTLAVHVRGALHHVVARLELVRFLRNDLPHQHQHGLVKALGISSRLDGRCARLSIAKRGRGGGGCLRHRRGVPFPLQASGCPAQQREGRGIRERMIKLKDGVETKPHALRNRPGEEGLKTTQATSWGSIAGAAYPIPYPSPVSLALDHSLPRGYHTGTAQPSLPSTHLPALLPVLHLTPHPKLVAETSKEGDRYKVVHGIRVNHTHCLASKRLEPPWPAATLPLLRALKFLARNSGSGHTGGGSTPMAAVQGQTSRPESTVCRICSGWKEKEGCARGISRRGRRRAWWWREWQTLRAGLEDGLLFYEKCVGI